MRTITDIEPQQKNPRRVNVYLDGEFAFGLAVITAAWLKVGQQLSEEKIAALLESEAQEALYQKALHFLSFRPRSSQEVRRNLLEREADPELVEQTLLRLQAAGLVNDQDFAQAWVENRNTFRPRGRTALRQELRQKGLDEQVVQEVLDNNVDEEALALQAARRQARRYAGLDRDEFRRKLGGFLARRGFSYSTLVPVVSQVWQECQAAEAGNKTENKD
jgi:regulatory protein